MTLTIIGRSSSHFTRVALMTAHELGVGIELVPIHDMARLEATHYAGNPALKLPTLRRADGSLLFGAENICRAIAELAAAQKTGSTPPIVWPEDLRSDVSRNAQELVWHAMAAQVQLIVGTFLGKLPPTTSSSPRVAKASRARSAGSTRTSRLPSTRYRRSAP